MCGIAGFVCNKDYDSRLGLTLTLLALEMQSRGRQSWGWTDGKQIVKDTGSIMDSWNYTLIQSHFKSVAIHTRHATTGGLTAANAHPYAIGDLIGMHNGIVYNHYELNRKHKRDCSVDSQQIFHHIVEGKDLGEIEAYGAICFFRGGKVYLGRFNGGELTLARTEFGWAWASTRKSLEQALERGGFEKGNTYLRLKEGRCYVLDGDKLLKSDIKLNFSTGRSTRKWDDDDWKGYCGGYGYSSGNTSSTDNKTHVYRYESSKQDFVPVDSGTGGTGGETTDASGSTVNGNRYTEKDILTASEAGSVEERIGEMVEKLPPIVNAGTSPVSEKSARPSEAKWKCSHCNEEITGEYYITTEYDVCCEDCGLRYAESLMYGPFRSLPEEILMVQSLFEKSRMEKPIWDCEECGEPSGPSEAVIETPEGAIICIECWRDQAMNSNVKDAQDAAQGNDILDSKDDDIQPPSDEDPEAVNDDDTVDADDEAVEAFNAALARDEEESNTDFPFGQVGAAVSAGSDNLTDGEKEDLRKFCETGRQAHDDSLYRKSVPKYGNEASNLKQFGAAVPEVTHTNPM